MYTHTPPGPRLLRLSVSIIIQFMLILTPLCRPGATPVRAAVTADPVGRVVIDTITGTLAGRVIDQNGNPVAGVRVRAINLETGNQRATLTNAEGRYQISFLPLGRYSIETVKSGLVVLMTTREPIKIQLNKVFETLPDIIMGPPPPAPVDPVPPPPKPPVPPPAGDEDSAGRLATLGDATRRLNAEERQIALLPLANIRSFDDLAGLAAGVAPPPEVKGVAGPGLGAGIGTPGQFAVNGLRARSNNFTVDGSDNNDEDIGVRRQGFVALTPQSIESVREIQIVSNLWDAEHGRSIGSQVNVVTKSGTNQVHGTLYNFFNHDSLNARNFFDLTSDKSASYALTATAIERFENGVPINTRQIPVTTRASSFDNPVAVVNANPSLGKDQYQRWQGGGALGLPLWRDRTFLFGSFERQRVQARQETHFAVPTVAQRGFLNFGASGLAATGDDQQPVYFSPTSIAGDSIFSLFPFPNNPVGPYGGNTFTQVLPADGQGTIFSLKLDHDFRFLQRLFGPDVSHNFTARYNFTDDGRVVPTVGQALFSSVKPETRTQNTSLFLNSQLSPTLANQMRLSYGRTRLRFQEQRDPYLQPSRFVPGEPYLLNARLISNVSTAEFINPFVDYRTGGTSRELEGNLGTVGQITISPFSPVGLDPYLFPQARHNNTLQFADTLTTFQGLHTLKFGADIRRTQLNSYQNRNHRPQVFFGGSPDLTCLIERAPIKNITQYGPNPGTCENPGFFTGADLAALGIPTGIFQSLAIGKPDSTIGLRFWQHNFFVNENWRTRHGLTLDFGLRYELNTTPAEVNRRIEKTFSLDGIPARDDSYQVVAPYSSGQIIYNNLDLASSFEQTLDALREVLGGRRQIYQTDRNNFNTHFSFAWDPLARRAGQTGRTVIRGGAGLYHDLTLGSVVNQSRNVFPTFIPYNVDVNTFSYAQRQFFQPGLTGIFAIFNPRFAPIEVLQNRTVTRYPLISDNTLNTLGVPDGALQAVLGLLFNPAAVGLAPSGGGLAFTLPDNRLRSPMAFQYNLQIEREVGLNWLFNLAWVGTRGVKLTRFRTPNGGPHSITLPVDPLALSADPIFAVALPPLSVGSDRSGRPNANLGAYTIFDSSATSTYHALQSTLTKRFADGYQLTAAYTWSHAIDDVSDVFDLAGASALPQDDRQLRRERGHASFDIRHRLAVSLTGGLPFLVRFNKARGVRGRLLGGWNWASISTIQTGQPFTVNTSYDVNLDGNLTDRLDTVAGLTRVSDGPTVLRLNTAPLSLLAPLGENGRVARNFFRAPGLFKGDVSLGKNFAIGQGHELTFRIEAFNVWNRSHFAIPVRILEAPSFGRSVNTLINPRQIQVALKYIF